MHRIYAIKVIVIIIFVVDDDDVVVIRVCNKMFVSKMCLNLKLIMYFMYNNFDLTKFLKIKQMLY